MLIFDCLEGLQKQPNILKRFCAVSLLVSLLFFTDKGMLVNIDKTKVMVFNTCAQLSGGFAALGTLERQCSHL